MEIVKEANVGTVDRVSGEELALINALARKELKGEEVFTFTVRLCDNQVDRDWERFPRKTLEELGELFVGKSGIFDHNWSAAGQRARIYKTQVVEEEGLTEAGEGKCYLKGWAYMLRTEGNKDLIAEIQGGIKKEVSVGCSVEKAVCSVCGAEGGKCGHEKGKTYEGKTCWMELQGAKDAYEWSFVAVPAQRKAGVMKGMATLKEVCDRNPELERQFKELEQEARVGRKYLARLREEVVRLCAVSRSGLEMDRVRSMADKLEEEELKALRDVLEGEGRERWSGGVQIAGANRERDGEKGDGAFLV